MKLVYELKKIKKIGVTVNTKKIQEIVKSLIEETKKIEIVKYKVAVEDLKYITKNLLLQMKMCIKEIKNPNSKYEFRLPLYHYKKVN